MRPSAQESLVLLVQGCSCFQLQFEKRQECLSFTVPSIHPLGQFAWRGVEEEEGGVLSYVLKRWLGSSDSSKEEQVDHIYVMWVVRIRLVSFQSWSPHVRVVCLSSRMRRFFFLILPVSPCFPLPFHFNLHLFYIMRSRNFPQLSPVSLKVMTPVEKEEKYSLV